LESVVSAAIHSYRVQLPGTVFHLNYTIPLALTHSVNGPRAYYLTVLVSDSCMALPDDAQRGALQILYWTWTSPY